MATSIISDFQPVEEQNIVTDFQPVQEKQLSLMKRAGKITSEYYDYLHTPTEKPESFKDFIGRVIPESISKTAVGITEAPFQIPYQTTKSIREALLKGDIVGMAKAAYAPIEGVARFMGEPLGLFGPEKVKEKWMTDPFGSLVGILPFTKIRAKPTEAPTFKGTAEIPPPPKALPPARFEMPETPIADNIFIEPPITQGGFIPPNLIGERAAPNLQKALPPRKYEMPEGLPPGFEEFTKAQMEKPQVLPLGLSKKAVKQVVTDYKPVESIVKRGKLTINYGRGGSKNKMEIGGTFVNDKFIGQDEVTIAYGRVEKTYGIYDKNGNQIKGGFDKASEAIEYAKSPNVLKKYPELQENIEFPFGENIEPTLTKFVRKNGGIKPDDILPGEVRRLSNKETGMTGLVTKNGKSVDKMTEAAIEKGLLPKGSTINDLLDATEQEIRNIKFGERGSISTRPIEPTPDYSQINPSERPIVEGVGEMYARTRKAIEDRHRITWDKIRDTFTRTIVDVSGNAKRSLVEKAGELGKEAVMDRDLIAGAAGKAGQIIEESHNSIYSGLSKRNNYLLNEYIQSRRTIEIDSYREGMKHPGGLTGADHQIYLNNFENVHGLKPGEMATIKTRADGYFQTMKGQLKELYDNGIINEESYNNLSKYDYSKREFMQYLDPENTINIGGRKINITESGIKPLKEGSIELLENNSERLLAEVISRTQSRIFKNRANNSLYNTATIHEKGWKKPENYVPENGLVSIEPFKDSVELSMFKNGNRHTFHVDKNLAKDWITSDPLINHTLSEVLQWASGAKILKAGATGYNPFFAFTNLPRDIALIWTSAEGKTAGYSATLPKYLGQLGRDLSTVASDVFKGKGRIKDFANEGGLMTFLTHYGKFRGQGVLTEKINSLSDLMSWAGEKSELWTRLALRERAIRNGISPKEATRIARNYLDFSQGGSFIKAVDTVLPYTSASVQGTRTIFRGAKTNPARFTYQMAQIGTLATGLYFANQVNKEAWDSISDRDKSANFIITTPFKYTDNQGQKRHLYYKIAKDQGQRIFASIFENLSSWYNTGKFSAEQVKMAIEDFTNMGISSYLPPSIKAVASYVLNKDFWTKLDVWRGPKGLEPKEEYSARTDPLFVGAGKVTGLSPERLKTAVSSVIPLNNPFVSLTMGGLKAITGQLSEEMKDKSMLQMFTDNPSIRRVLSTTNPYTPYKEEMEEAKTEEVTRRYRIDRVFDDLLEKYMKQKTVENYNNFMGLVERQSEVDKDRLLQRAKRRIEYLNIPDKTWWFKLSELPPEIRAEVFWKRYSNAKPNEQKQLYEIGQKLPGISSDRFLERLYELQQ